MIEFVRSAPEWLMGHPVAALAAGLVFAGFCFTLAKLNREI